MESGREHSVMRWPLSLIVAVLTWTVGATLDAPPRLVSALGLTWFAATMAVFSHDDIPVLRGDDSWWWTGGFAIVTVLVVGTLEDVLGLRGDTELVVGLTIFGLVYLGAGVGAVLAQRSESQPDTRDYQASTD